MDSKPIAIIIAIVITIGAMGAVIVTSTNILSGTSSSNDLLPKNVEVLQINKAHLEVNVQMTNSGQATLENVKVYLEVDGIWRYNVTANDNIEPYKTLSISGSAKSPANGAKSITDLVRFEQLGYGLLPPFTQTNILAASAIGVLPNWDVYPGEQVLLRVIATTSSGDQIEKLHTITVK